MALPKEPRQKMINIMYLVLTAILALNVSSEILNAFKTMDESFVRSNTSMEDRITNLIAGFDQKDNVERFPEKVAEWKPRAEKIKAISNTVYQYLDALKTEVKKESGQKNPNDPYKEDDLEAATRMFTNGKPGETKGEELYNILNKYKADLAAIDNGVLASQVNKLPNFTVVSDTIKKQYSTLTPAEQFANAYFHMTPTVAAVAMLTKFQNDVKNSELQLIESCYAQLNAVPYVPSFGVVASASSALVMSGDELTITAGLGAYAKDAQPVVTIDGANVTMDANGQAVLKVGTSSAGDFTKNVSITYIDPTTNKKETKTAQVKYKVGIPTGLAVSADATRYFYAGGEAAPNPITVSGSAGGAGAIKVIPVENVARVDNTGPGTYNVICKNTGFATLSITDGKSTQQLKIKVKPLPDPKFAYAAGGLNPTNGRGGEVSVADFKDCYGLKAVLPDDFEFKKVEYNVKSFKMTFAGKGFGGIESATCTSSSFNDAAKALISRCVSGSSVQITNIVVQDNASGIHEIPNVIAFNLR
jgi:gliding motility-associated protein GldM